MVANINYYKYLYIPFQKEDFDIQICRQFEVDTKMRHKLLNQLNLKL